MIARIRRAFNRCAHAAVIAGLLGPAMVSAQASSPVRALPRRLSLPSGDSTILLSAKPIQGMPIQTMFIRFHPYAPFTDTLAMRRIAVEIWRQFRPQLDSGKYSHLLLQATTGDGARGGMFDHNYPMVLERRNDNRWYFMRESAALKEK